VFLFIFFPQNFPCLTCSDIHGTFNVKIEVFIQSKEKGKEAVYEMPESLGTLNFDVSFLLFVLGWEFF